jgi:DEAD/DEAH box helicase/Helicase conserved C-terminal domain
MKDVIDPLATSERITETYHRYLTSLLSLRDSRLAAGLSDKIRTSGSMTRGPYLDVTPPYEKGASIRDLVDQGLLSHELLNVCSGALPADRPLYVHQERAIRKAVAGRSLVVATGTGSGKTEGFLVPILDSLAREHDAGTLVPGVRALLLYPMNALANDQVKRLREILRGYPHITFGRYTGETPEDPRKASELFAQLNAGMDPIPNELLSRAEMKATPPHILLTNYAMLEYLLIRPLDTPLFDGPEATSWRWLVVDEAHVYGGSQGAEIAMLLRRVQQRVSKDGPLQSILTSATVGDDPALVAEFASRLTRADVEWIPGDDQRCDVVPAVHLAVPERGSWGPLDGDDYARLATADDPGAQILQIAASRGWVGANAGEALAHESRLVELKNHLASGPLTLNQIIDGLPESGWTPEGLTACVRVASGLLDTQGEPVLSARYHLFAKATEGAFSCLGKTGPHVALTRHESCPECHDPMFEFGSCQRCGHIYLVGERDERDGRTWFRPTSRPGVKAVWLLLDPPTSESTSPGPSDEDEEVLGEASQSEHQDQWICSSCACLSQSVGRCPSCASEQMRPVRIAHGMRTEIKECLHCGSRNPDIRTFSTGNDAAAAVLSTALYQEIPSAENETSTKSGNGRKLLMFSDSRQSAAFFATYLEDTYDRIRRRALILDGLREDEPLNIEDLASEVAKRAGELGLFQRRDSRQKRERTASLWVMQELLSLDERQSLQGLGQMLVRFDKDPKWCVPQPLLSLGLTQQQAWDLVEVLVTILINQGAVTMPEDVQANDEAFAPRLGPVYVRGTGSEARHKILSWEPSRNSVTNRRIDFLKRVLTAVGATPDKAADILSGLWSFLSRGMPDGWLAEAGALSGGLLWRVDHTWLQLQQVRPGRELFRCSSCQQVAPVSVAGVCPTMGCDGRLAPWALPDPGTDPDHYRALHRNILPVGMSVSEHTAQWQPRAAAKIQQDFINGDVNVLSCSTTFELGVDVGELEAVMLRNMPPSTANYVQRAGRAGRRASSAAVILTFAQRRPHDLARYQRPTEMIAGRVQAPYVYLDNDRIGRRHAHSVALSFFMRHALETTGTVWRRAGEFFAGEGRRAPNASPSSSRTTATRSATRSFRSSPRQSHP